MKPQSVAAGRPTPGAIARLAPALGVVLLTVIGPLLVQHGIDEPVTAPYAPPEPGALLGGDQLGRDVLSRLFAGGRDLLATSAAVAVAVTGISAVLGALSALRRTIRSVVERTADLLILLPAVLAIMVIGTAWPVTGRLPVVIAAIVLGTPFAVRVAGAAADPVARSGFVEVAEASGGGALSIAFREILPNIRGTLVTLFGLRFVEAVYVVATAGFLEIGVQPPAADWAVMIRENAEGIMLNPWGAVAPGLAIAVLSISVHAAADLITPTPRTRAVNHL